MLSSILTSLLLTTCLAGSGFATEPELSHEIHTQSEPASTMQLFKAAESEIAWTPGPRHTPELRTRVLTEIADNPEIDSALRLILDSSGQPLRVVRVAWDTLEDHDAIWSLVALANLNGSTRPMALRSLTRLGDPKVVPDLIRLADHMPDLESESDSPEFHRIYCGRLRLLLSRLTSVWLLDEDVTLSQAALQWRIAHENHRLSEIELARRALHRQLSETEKSQRGERSSFGTLDYKISARIAYLNALRREYGPRLQARGGSGDLDAKFVAARAAGEAVERLLTDWSPVGWTREEIERVFGKHGQFDDESITYWWDWGFGGFGLHIGVIGDRRAHSFERLMGE